MFPFGHPAGMPFHPLGLPFPCSGHDMRKQYIAVMHGRKEGYVAAMKDVRGAGESTFILTCVEVGADEIRARCGLCGP